MHHLRLICCQLTLARNILITGLCIAGIVGKLLGFEQAAYVECGPTVLFNEMFS